MERKIDYIPKQDDKLSVFLQNFNQKAPEYAEQMGIPAGEVTTVKTQSDQYDLNLAAVETAKTAAKNATSTKDASRTTVVNSVRKLAASMKTNAKYTEAIGKDLGIIGAEVSWDPNAAQPTLKLSTSGGHVVLNFDKAQSNGIKIWSRRGNEEAFSFLAQDTHPPYHDNRPNLATGIPEKREYYAYYVVRDEPVGQQSAIASVVV